MIVVSSSEALLAYICAKWETSAESGEICLSYLDIYIFGWWRTWRIFPQWTPSCAVLSKTSLRRHAPGGGPPLLQRGHHGRAARLVGEQPVDVVHDGVAQLRHQLHPHSRVVSGK